MPLHRLNAELVRRGWALTNLGDIDRQTVAGALVHRHARHRGARSAAWPPRCAALELVPPTATVLRCDAATSTPTSSPPPGSGWARSACVSAVTLQAVPAFALRAVEGPGTLTALLEGFDELMTSTDHVEFYWFPHTDADLTKCNTRVPLDDGLAPLPRWRAVWDDEILANGAFAGVVAAGRRVPALVPPLARFSARALAARTCDRPLAPRLRLAAAGSGSWRWSTRCPAGRRRSVLAELRGPCEANDWRVAVPGGGPRRRGRRHPAVDRVGPRQRLHRRARARGHRARARTSPRSRRSPARSAAARTGASCTAWTPRRCARGTRGSASSSRVRDRLDPDGRLRQRLPRPGARPGRRRAGEGLRCPGVSAAEPPRGADRGRAAGDGRGTG